MLRRVLSLCSLLLIFLVAITMLMGCKAGSQVVVPARFVETGQKFDIEVDYGTHTMYVVEDTKTDILYLMNYDGAMTPWLDTSGNPMRATNTN